jgi:hypothetical protein
MNIKTLVMNDKVNKRSLAEVDDMEVDKQSSSKRTKTATQDKYIIAMEDKESINQGI